MKGFIQKVISFFLYINSGIMIIFYFFARHEESVPSKSIPRIMLIAALTAIVTAVIFSIEPKRPMKKIFNAGLFVLHMVLLCLIVFWGGTSFGWFERSWKGFLPVLLSVVFVYIFTAVIYITLRNQETKELNDAIKKYTDDESH